MVSHESGIRVLGFGFLPCVLVRACLLCISESCLPMRRVPAVLFRAFVGLVAISPVVLAVF